MHQNSSKQWWKNSIFKLKNVFTNDWLMNLSLIFWCFSIMVFNFARWWVDGWTGNEYFWIPHKISDLLTSLAPLTPLVCVCSICWLSVWKWNWNRLKQFLPVCTRKGFFRILKKTSSQLSCAPLYIWYHSCLKSSWLWNILANWKLYIGQVRKVLNLFRIRTSQ